MEPSNLTVTQINWLILIFKNEMGFSKKLILLFLAFCLVFGACRTQKKPRTLKPGKPIPCPQKDCY